MELTMKYGIEVGPTEKIKSNCLIIGISAPLAKTRSNTKKTTLPVAFLEALPDKHHFTAALGQAFITLTPKHKGSFSTEYILAVGLGEKVLLDSEFRGCILKIITLLVDAGVTEATFHLDDFKNSNKSTRWKIHQIIQIVEAQRYVFNPLKRSKSKSSTKNFPSILFHFQTHSEARNAKIDLEEGLAIARAIQTTKDLANLPANVCTPSYLATAAKQLAKQYTSLKATVLEETQIRALKMGLFLSVTQGSQNKAKFIILSYQPKQVKKAKPIVLVGKGITFDTGGNSIKIPPHMIGMKYDMCGAATVFGVMQAACQLKLPFPVIGVIPSCENMPGPSATRPEDVVTSMSGKTVEILNTDAEGRLILADALTYCEKFSPECVIDIATLTGACAAALGPYASGLMANDPDLAKQLLESGYESGDRVWELPLWEDYYSALKTDFADLSNIPTADIGARTIVAGCFLATFATSFRWAHLDVANTAFVSNGPQRGATGRPIPLLLEYLIQRSKQPKK